MAFPNATIGPLFFVFDDIVLFFFFVLDLK